MSNKIKNRLASEQGFTLIELLVVIVILGILVAIAVPAYLSFRGNAQDAAAKANVRSAIPAAEEYYQEDTVTGFKTAEPDSYDGLNNAAMVAVAPGVSPDALAGANATADGYCIQDTEGSSTFSYTGGTGGTATIASGACDASFNVG